MNSGGSTAIEQEFGFEQESGVLIHQFYKYIKQAKKMLRKFIIDLKKNV